jgi:hypothetical protein
MSHRPEAVGSVMTWVGDMLEINGVEHHRPGGYAVEYFTYDGWDMTLQITARRTPTPTEESPPKETT